jgi:type 1 glutamine amidotransferase
MLPLYSQDKPLNVLVITGGHDFEHKQFFEMFDGFKGISYVESKHPEADKLIRSKEINNFDILVFYDMPKEIDTETKNAFLQLLKKGKNMVFLHHSLASYPDWPEFTQILGGKYLEKATATHGPSSYKHDVEVPVSIINKKHPITFNMNDFTIHDEVYGNFLVIPNVTPLLITTHPESSPVIGWTNQYKKARIVYLQSGHDHYAYENANYRKLVYRSILWVSGKLE